ncbi:MAG: hypothetical protein ACN4GK_04340 [Acidimicrobiia bacterium]
MAIRIGIVARTPTVQRGLAAVLTDSGYKPVPLAGLESWSPGKSGSAVIVVVRDEAMKESVRLFSDDHPHVPIVGISPDSNVGALAELIRLGAFTALGEDDPTEQLVGALGNALSGHTLLPLDIARAMAARVPPPADPAAWISDDELGWLRSLTQGVTVPELAVAAGYSEREMFRVLQRMYQRIGVANRTEAIIWATKNGLL